jgi:hypothetical protein
MGDVLENLVNSEKLSCLRTCSEEMFELGFKP